MKSFCQNGTENDKEKNGHAWIRTTVNQAVGIQLIDHSGTPYAIIMINTTAI